MCPFTERGSPTCWGGDFCSPFFCLPLLCSSFKGSCRRLRGWEIKGLKSLSATPYLPLKRENKKSCLLSKDTIHIQIFLTFGSNILQLNCYDIFIFYTVYRNVIIDIRITIILSTYMNQSNLMIIQNFIILSFIISYLVCDQEWILYIIIFRSLIFWNQMNNIP